MAGRRGPGAVVLLGTIGVAGAGFYLSTAFEGQLSTIGPFIMAFGIVLFFLGLLFRLAS